MYESVDPAMFVANVDVLVAILRKHIPEHGFGEVMHAARHNAVRAIHTWMVDHLVKEKATGSWGD